MNIECEHLNPIINIIQSVLMIVQWAIPIIIIVIGTFDIMKAVIASKEDEIKAAQKMLIKRVVYAVIIFLIPSIVYFVFNIVSNSGTEGTGEFWKCWKQSNQDQND